jgi:hypothetical protein
LSSQHVAGDLPNVHAPDRDVDGSPATFKSSSRAAPLRFTPLVVPQCPLSRAANADRSDRQHAQGKQPPCGAAIANGTFNPPGFRLRLGHKDARLLSEAASTRNVPMLSGNLIMDASPPR